MMKSNMVPVYVQSMNRSDFIMNNDVNQDPHTEETLKVLREINSNPRVTQRELSLKLGISLGKVNFLIQALMQKGLIKVQNFKKSNNKIAYLYFLTSQGIEEKAKTTYFFLKRKIQEYEKLEEEIRQLKEEAHNLEQYPTNQD
jgi:EPS-associated MarR family transcriptional regulator